MLVNLADLHRALSEDEIVPVFQPLVELRTGRLVGFEVLARWNHPELGLTLPTNFIPLAEEYGFAADLMHQVFRKAFRACRYLPPHLGLAVNVSATQLSDLSLPHQIEQLAEDEGFSLHRLTVEITESALLKDLQRAKDICQMLQRKGCRVSLDDFGTGYSSLGHLHALAFDQLKIDRSFIASMMTSRESRKIVASIVGLGHSLGLAVVAEGVETEEQADRMLRLGCEIGQGWLYGRPTAENTIFEMTAASRYSPSAKTFMPGMDPLESCCLEAVPEQRLSQLVAIYDGAPVGLCFLDLNLLHVSVNKRLADMNGVSIQAHIGQHVSAILGESYTFCEPYLRQALAGNAVRGVELLLPSKVGQSRSAKSLVSYEPAFDEAGEVVGVSVAVIDIPVLKHPKLWRGVRASVAQSMRSALPARRLASGSALIHRFNERPPSWTLPTKLKIS